MAATNYSPIQLYYSTTASAAPAAGNLVSGELAINITDGKLYYKDNAGTVQLLSTSTTANGTANGVLYLNGSKVATSGSALTFDGSTLGSGYLNIGSAASFQTNSRVAIQTSAGKFDIAAYGGSSVQLMSNGALAYYTPSNSFDQIWLQGASELMRLTSTGLGIGTSSPAYKLDVVGAINASAANPTGFNHALRTTGVTTGRSQIYLNNTSGDLVLGVEGSSGGTSYSGTAAYSSFAATSGANPFYVITNSAIRATFDSSGNLGLGVTPSAWNTSRRALQIGGASGGYVTADNGLAIASNYAFTTADKFVGNGYAPLYFMSSSNGQHQWFISGNNVSGAGAAWTPTQAMTLDASGRLAVGTTSASAQFHVLNASGNYGLGSDSTGMALVESTYGSTGSNSNASFIAKNLFGYSQFMQWENYGVRIGSRGTANGGAGALVFTSGNDNESARIDSSGNLLVGTTSLAANERLNVVKATANSYVVRVENSNNVQGDQVFRSILGSNANNTNSYHFVGTTGGTDRFYVYGNGNVQNSNNSYGGISDVKLKENIVDATPKLADLMQVKVRNYNLKSDPEQKQLGVIAQELEQVFPAMIDETPDRDAEGNDLGTTTKSVKYSVFVPMLIKAMQEQQAQIESLRKRLADAGIA